MRAERSKRKEWKSFQIKIITCICKDGEATAAGIFRHFSPSTCWRAVKTEATEEIKTENCQKPTRGNFLTFFFLRSLSLPLAHSSLLTFGVINISFLSKISLVRSLATHKKLCNCSGYKSCRCLQSFFSASLELTLNLMDFDFFPFDIVEIIQHFQTSSQTRRQGWSITTMRRDSTDDVKLWFDSISLFFISLSYFVTQRYHLDGSSIVKLSSYNKHVCTPPDELAIAIALLSPWWK